MGQETGKERGNDDVYSFDRTLKEWEIGFIECKEKWTNGWVLDKTFSFPCSFLFNSPKKR